MISFDPNSMCEQIKAYYYEYLFGETKECVPTQMLGHIDRCSFCQAEVGRLKGILADGKENVVRSTRDTTTVLTTNLRFHFAYLGAFVDCNTLKLFLPGLAIPALEVSVPTPITVHLDKCKQCAKDLETVRQLKLTNEQLSRLGQLFAEKRGKYNISCRQAHPAVLAVLSMDFRETKKEVLKHVCTCPYCRKLLYQYREAFRSEHLSKKRKQEFPCNEVSVTDIFDYVVPYGLDPANDQYAKFRESLTLHVMNCPRCLDKMQKLHDTVYSILERHESGIATCYNICDSGRDSTVSSSDDLYEDWPIEVQVFDNSTETETIKTRDASPVEGIAVPLEPEPKRKLSFLRPFIKPAVAAAAVILAALFLFNAPTAKAVNLRQISKALEMIKNVCITTFYQEESNKTQEIWVSQVLNIKILKTKAECVLWDIKAKSQTTRDLNTGSIATISLNTDVLLKIKETMEGSLGLLRFNSMREAPEGAKWLPDIETTIHNTEVYDLIWTEKSLIGSIIHRKWRVYTDTETKLPKRIEWLLKLPDEKEYKLETITTVSYPTTVKVKAVIKEAGF
ncbi:MAG: hypothetical protein FVQ85_19990 [Planctomycetes bacterium]|nr:hypothetical protein [Planctomycetota bacterium]